MTSFHRFQYIQSIHTKRIAIYPLARKNLAIEVVKGRIQ